MFVDLDRHCCPAAGCCVPLTRAAVRRRGIGRELDDDARLGQTLAVDQWEALSDFGQRAETCLHMRRCLRRPYRALAHWGIMIMANRNQHLYGTQHWRRLARQQLQREPLCAECARKGMVAVATEADHVERHRGDRVKFFTGALQSLCKACHEAKTAGEEGVRHRGYDRAIGEDGLPIDPNHPANVREREREAKAR